MIRMASNPPPPPPSYIQAMIPCWAIYKFEKELLSNTTPPYKCSYHIMTVLLCNTFKAIQPTLSNTPSTMRRVTDVSNCA